MEKKTTALLRSCKNYNFDLSASPNNLITRKPCYRKDDRAMRPMYTYKLCTLILFTLTVTILCADFDSERI